MDISTHIPFAEYDSHITVQILSKKSYLYAFQEIHDLTDFLLDPDETLNSYSLACGLSECFILNGQYMPPQ